MPPFVPRRRDHASSAPATATATRAKATLFDAADAPRFTAKSAGETKNLLDGLDSDESSLSDVESDEFEDIPPAKQLKLDTVAEERSDDDDNDHDDEMDWEDAMRDNLATAPVSLAEEDLDIQDISVTINDDGSYVEPDLQERMSGTKQGSTKRERLIRNLTHCLHVQSLLWHNTIRNSWLNDEIVQKTLVDAVTDGVKREITRWREAMGILTKEELEAKKGQAAAKNKGKKARKSAENGRDWSYEAQHSEQGIRNLSAGDPLLRLLKVLTAYWRKRFVVSAPAFRKQGYMPLRRLRQEIKDWQKDPGNAEEHGERIESIDKFRELAKECEGSRDVGGQLFVALLRGIGLETRMVGNLQPAGIGWSRAEEADVKRLKRKAVEEQEPEAEPEPKKRKKPINTGSAKKTQLRTQNEKSTRRSARGNKAEPITLDDYDDSSSDTSSDHGQDGSLAEDQDDDDDRSLIDVTPVMPRKKQFKKYDRDLAFPTYWTEVCSPVSHKFIPVDPIVLSTIASNEELLQTFEPRGKKAELAKQVICYVIAFCSDGTAKDVTVRYLKKHQLPGKTKGMRMSIEKIAIHNKRGKVKKYEQYDWFRTVMALYDRPENKRTPADDLEEQTDLKPFKPQKQGNDAEKESLQWYKQSAEFVLEQHLRREEAIVPGAESVKTFTAGKGDKAKEHDVYRRDDVVTCKTVESWHKEGRAVKEGEQPIKHVPMRAVTLIKKREIEEAERETGEKMKQGLYARNQTDWIIPPPIENGVIPKNAYGNMDVYVETMVPKGAVHLELKGSAKICRSLGIDYAEACTGFEFGKQRAVPVLTGVVVAKENKKLVTDAWHAAQEEIKRKEDTKRTNTSLHWWRKMLMGMRIVERMRAEYENTGVTEEETNPFVSKAKRAVREKIQFDNEAGGGGFLLPGEGESPRSPVASTAHHHDADMGGGFLPEIDEEELEASLDGGVLIEENPEDTEIFRVGDHAPVTPVSLQSMHKTSSRRGGKDEDQDEDMEEAPDAVSITLSRRGSSKKHADRAKVTAARAGAKAKGRSRQKRNLPKLESDDESDTLQQFPEVPRSTSALRKPRAAKKATLTKSPYFIDTDDTGDDHDDDALSSEQEVVKPARTTARTRKSA